MKTWATAVVILCGLAGVLFVRAGNLSSEQVIEITVEMRQSGNWKPVSSQRVFHSKDDIRFRVRSTVSGYLYVLNHESGGDRSWLYPRPNQEQANRIEADKTYTVPDAKGSFIVGGAPGFDVTYWMITPEALDVPASGKQSPGKPSTLLPRCGELKARESCEDERAGAHAVSDSSDIPQAFSASGGLIARDLKFESTNPGVRISSPEAPSGSIVYALWIAHQ